VYEQKKSTQTSHPLIYIYTLALKVTFHTHALTDKTTAMTEKKLQMNQSNVERHHAGDDADEDLFLFSRLNISLGTLSLFLLISYDILCLCVSADKKSRLATHDDSIVREKRPMENSKYIPFHYFTQKNFHNHHV
jgi:hypothetical protein